MTSFRLGRYLVALLWSWSVPLLVGVVLGGGYVTYTTLEILRSTDDAFVRAVESAVESCTTSIALPINRSPPASGTGPPVAGDGGETG